jgi:hypothetical protein
MGSTGLTEAQVSLARNVGGQVFSSSIRQNAAVASANGAMQHDLGFAR